MAETPDKPDHRMSNYGVKEPSPDEVAGHWKQCCMVGTCTSSIGAHDILLLDLYIITVLKRIYILLNGSIKIIPCPHSQIYLL